MKPSIRKEGNWWVIRNLPIFAQVTCSTWLEAVGFCILGYKLNYIKK